MAYGRNVTRNRQNRPPQSLNSARLEALALHYAARYATSRAKLATYLGRKLREAEWDDERPPAVEALVERLAELRYVDDSAYAAMRGAALTRRGYGARRVAQALDAAGVGKEGVAQSASEGWDAANAFARRKRIGPYGAGQPDRALRDKQVGAFLRAGHDYATAARWVDAAPGDVPDRVEED
ncbi:hypothetical protein BH10PSE13_BH10PSE13_23370 [soil metagenome]